jgi:menaquinone-specific isochorismate synthase
MHPTPAVCGEPKDIALKIIRENENFDRGLFSGVLGWFNKSGSGEFIVGIRSAHLKDSILTVFAGCGIVKDSDAKKEFEETDLKFKSILSIFTDEKIS